MGLAISLGMLAIAAALVFLGWLGIARSEELAGGASRYGRQQGVWSAVAVVAAACAAAPSYRLLCRWSYALFAAALGLLTLVYFFPAVHGASLDPRGRIQSPAV